MKRGFVVPLMLSLLCVLGVCSAVLFKTTLLWQRFAQMHAQQVVLEQGAECYFWQGVVAIRNNPRDATIKREHTVDEEPYEGAVEFRSVGDHVWSLTAHCGARSGRTVSISARVTVGGGFVEVADWKESPEVCG